MYKYRTLMTIQRQMTKDITNEKFWIIVTDFQYFADYNNSNERSSRDDDQLEIFDGNNGRGRIT